MNEGGGRGVGRRKGKVSERNKEEEERRGKEKGE